MQHDGNSDGVVTVSIGVGPCRALPGRGAQDLIEAADAVLHRPKRAGGNRVEADGDTASAVVVPLQAHRRRVAGHAALQS